MSARVHERYERKERQREAEMLELRREVAQQQGIARASRVAADAVGGALTAAGIGAAVGVASIEIIALVGALLGIALAVYALRK